MSKHLRVIISCEHGGNRVPRGLAPLLKPVRHLLTTHRGYDPGALALAKAAARALACPLHASTTTRLLADLNRSRENPGMLGPTLAHLDRAAIERLVREHYDPYRREVDAAVLKQAARAPTLHVSMHTFTPVLYGQRRRVHVGVLYDPARAMESRLASAWVERLRTQFPRLTVEHNQPYLGTDDGLTTYLRTRTAPDRYAGIELEVSQRFARAGGDRWARIVQGIVASLRDVVASAETAAANPSKTTPQKRTDPDR